MGRARNWTSEEIEYLQENYGIVSIGGLAKKLNRSENAIVVQSNRLHLGSFLENGDYITLNQLYLAVKGRTVGTYDMVILQRWGFPIKYRRVKDCKFRVVYLDEFWDWAEKNQTHFSLASMEPGVLGKEPEWVRKCRSNQFQQSLKLNTHKPWSQSEDMTLERMIASRCSIKQICNEVHRSAGAIYKRVELKGLEQPRAEEKCSTKWDDDEYELLEQMVLQRKHPVIIAEEMPRRSEKSIRAKIYNAFGTEDIDEASQHLLAGEHIKEQAHYKEYIKQYRAIKKQRKMEKAETDALRSNLAYVLQQRMLQLGWGEYWQKDTCMNWDPARGCTAGESNCDECGSFKRIPPQYCCRCGRTFFERNTETFCASCRNERLRTAQRKWARLHAKQGVE